jgi:S1-C subfamily serine protease
MAIATDISEGQWCVATGHPGGFERDRKPVVRVGRVLSKQKDLLITDCALVGGDSGGPLVDGQGRVIGIHSRIGAQLTANMHVPVHLFTENWDRLKASEAWGHLPGQTPFLGVQGDQDGDTARISRVYVGTPAEKAGFKAGDVVTKFNEKPVTTFDSLTSMIAECQVGDKVKIVVVRGGETLEFEVALARRGR